MLLQPGGNVPVPNHSLSVRSEQRSLAESAVGGEKRVCQCRKDVAVITPLLHKRIVRVLGGDFWQRPYVAKVMPTAPVDPPSLARG